MAQVKINLQAPPNADFVSGYPGIPPGQERGQAAVKGAVEIRVPATGVKAKWVRVELRKVETLPGGGPDNIFKDYVGPSPVNLFTSADEYTVLRSQDFPFLIRIPESIPPSIALEQRAGIAYELEASICTKGKKGFLRKAKSTVTSIVTTILIDKHELHSTWPVYCQAETRHLTQEGVNLIAERGRTCFGPGDVLSALVTVKSDSLHTVILRGLEMYLVESTTYRPGHQSPNRKPTQYVRNISETKIAINSTLYGGSSHTSDLSFHLSDQHTTTTLTSARHIDVKYELVIKALMGTGNPLTLTLPVIISNWQRHISQEAMNRIGPAPGLSILPTVQSSYVTPPATRVDPARERRPADAVAATLPNSIYGQNRTPANAYNTVAGTPAGDDGYASRPPDEFGAPSRTPAATPAISVTTSTPSNNTTSARRPLSAGGSGGTRPFTVSNAQPGEIPSPTLGRQASAQASNTPAGTGPGPWLTAEEEKLKLYEKARAQVAKVQGTAAAPIQPPASVTSIDQPSVTSSPARTPAPVVPPTTTVTPQPQKKGWLTAEEEKLQLFQKATAAAARTQGVPYSPPPPTTLNHVRQTSDPKNQISSGSGPAQPSAAAQMYAQALNQNRGGASGYSGSGSGSGSSAPPAVPKPSSGPLYSSAEQEKAALRRYQEARDAVQRTQNASFADDIETPAPVVPGAGGPISYDSLYPTNAPSSSPPPLAADEPPPFDGSPAPVNAFAQLSEKERLRREYERRDGLASQRKVNGSSPPPAAYTAPPPAAYTAPPANPPPPGPYANAYEEKEAMRKKLEARDQAQALAAQARIAHQTAGAAPPPTPPRSNTANSTDAISPGRSPNGGSFRPTPALPVPGGSSAGRVLTAAEEKAMLRAKFEARDSGRKAPPTSPTPPPRNGNGGFSTGTPPPLMPRPPAEYIKETQEEDARLSKINGDIPNLGGSSSGQLEIKPFTPFRAGFDPTITRSVGNPPLSSRTPGE